MAKTVFTIAPGISFIDALAEGLWKQSQGDVFRLADTRIFLPTRRACLHLREAFLRHMDKQAALLPRMQPLGDVDEEEFFFADANIDTDIPPAIAPLRRKLLLTQLIMRKDENMRIDQAAQLADALAQFLDQAQIMRCDFSKLATLVEEQDLAEHWKQTVTFLEILTTAWPEILAAEGCIDPAERRNRLLETQAAAWRAEPPKFPIIAAGSTGTMPATADFLDAIASLPNGTVILPGLDQQLDEESWQAISETHPQHGMKGLLKKFGVKRNNVKIWSASPDKQHSGIPLPLREGLGEGQRCLLPDPSPAKTKDLRQVRKSKFSLPPPQGGRDYNYRTRLLQESMRPAEVTEEWRNLNPTDIPPEALQGLASIELNHPQEEAQAIALIMRATLETPNKTAALVTPDRNLAERVAGLLARWDIEANDSGGTSLAVCPTGGFLLDVLAAASPDAGAVDFLSLLKHPFAACGLSPAVCRAQAREIEVSVWRNEKPEKSDWLDQFKKSLKPLSAQWKKHLPLPDWIAAHRDLAKTLAASDSEPGASRLWQGDDGEAAATWLDDWRASAHGFPPMTGEDYQGLFTQLVRTITVRPKYTRHPRLTILGPLEARLIQSDVMILGGLNEGVWPPEAAVDPWMSRPMKENFGLTSPERRIGLSAHDFVQLASAPEVVLTRARRAGNAPTVPSRFLLQLETVLRALGYEKSLAASEPWQGWAQMLDEPEKIVPCAAPQPRPPAAARPTQLSVTEIGTWQRNPYAIYAKHILKLRKLDPLDAEIDVADRGTVIHEALDRFIKTYPDHLPPNALEELLALGRKLFAAYDEHPQAKAFWWPRFERIAAWFVANEQERRAEGIKVLKAEATGKMAFDTFTLKGRADRIDCLPDGKLAIIDYKTGGVPTSEDVKQGLDPQLPLLALIAEQGGFEGLNPAPVGEIAYWKLSGGREAAEKKPVKEDIKQLAENARAGLEQLVKKFADQATPYLAVPKPNHRPRYDDYGHLARLAEWGRTGSDE